MAAARKRAFNGRSMAAESRTKAIAAIQICWKRMRPDLDPEESRDERLAWIAGFLGLRSLESITELTDAQLGSVAGEMKRLTGTPFISKEQSEEIRRKQKQIVADGVLVEFPKPAEAGTPNTTAEIIHLASHEQQYVLETLDWYIRWSKEKMEGYLFKRFKSRTFRMLTFKQATACTFQMLSIAAHRDLKAVEPDRPVSRQDIAHYIPKLKAKLGIDQGQKSQIQN